MPAAGSVASARIERLETELARMQEERAQEADDLAAMLVRIADAERERTAAEEHAAELLGRLREVESLAEQALRPPPPPPEDPRVAQLQSALEQSQTRAALAERSAADGAAALERAHAELQADRVRVVDLEAKLARVRREHGEAMAAAARTRAEEAHQATEAHAREVTALRGEHASIVDALRKDHGEAMDGLRREHEEALEAARAKAAAEAREHEEKHARALAAVRDELAALKRASARALEEERSATARARQQIGVLEGGLSASRQVAARARQQLEELARRDEAAAAQRTAALEVTLRTLSGGGEERSTAAAAPAPRVQVRSPVSPDVSLDEIEIDIAD
jgi:DNA repair exonuclease SbcCD ATPase subunit